MLILAGDIEQKWRSNHIKHICSYPFYPSLYWVSASFAVSTGFSYAYATNNTDVDKHIQIKLVSWCITNKHCQNVVCDQIQQQRSCEKSNSKITRTRL